MNGICVVTSKAGAYYAIVSRLRKAGLPFVSILAESDFKDCAVVLTTSAEAGRFGGKVAVLEELDDDPGVFKGQILSRLVGASDTLLIGVDPGSRTGMAAYYGEATLAFHTFAASPALCSMVGAFVGKVPARKSVVRIGNGNPAHAARLAESIRREAPAATIELVDESGTTSRSARMRGVQGDQRAAARIAFRKGEVVSPGNPRTRA
ncbi:MAG: hypothetical protein OK438_05380 [Thaumarchaeota archaeon]|nr:hypothetical protein [Nitrososphaerota archaeon]